MGKNKFMHEDIGFNYRLPNVSAAMGLGQFNQISEIFKQKRELIVVIEKFKRCKRS